jgi:ribosomal protein S18 acetylase RimI-like enzyme
MELLTVSFRTIPCEGDIIAIRSIITSTNAFRTEEISVAVDLLKERLRIGIASGYHFVFAEENNDIIGYTCFGPIACTVASYDIFWIAVAKEHHGRKIGSALMVETEQQITAMGGKRIYIETSSHSNYQATRGFYQRHGYTVEATIKNFYDDNDDKIIYLKDLRDSYPSRNTLCFASVSNILESHNEVGASQT